MKKLFVAVVVVLAFVAGYLLPRQNVLKKDREYRAGNYRICFREYRGKGNRVYQKIDIQGKHALIGGIYKKGATIENAGK